MSFYIVGQSGVGKSTLQLALTHGCNRSAATPSERTVDPSDYVVGLFRATPSECAKYDCDILIRVEKQATPELSGIYWRSIARMLSLYGDTE